MTLNDNLIVTITITTTTTNNIFPILSISFTNYFNRYLNVKPFSCTKNNTEQLLRVCNKMLIKIISLQHKTT